MKKSITRLLCILICFASALGSHGNAEETGKQSKLELTSSDQRLVQAFAWAKKQAMGYVFDQDPVGPWYEAALPGREAFCMRDVSHQTMGAQALGLAPYTLNMLRLFAANISRSKDWCSYWEIDRNNRPSPADYKSDSIFWYNLPANFDVLDSCYRMYLWTGDPTYLEDPTFVRFYDHTMSDYVRRWTLAPDRVMSRQRWLYPLTEEERREQNGESRFRLGIPSYDEQEKNFVVGIDLLAAEYAAYRDYAQMKFLSGDSAIARQAAANAAALKRLINTSWWDAKSSHFYAFLDEQQQMKGRESAAVLYYGAAEGGFKTQSALDDLLSEAAHVAPCAVEGESHYAEIFYKYGATGAAYSVIMDLTKPGHCRQEYPEVSYSVIGAITTGLMGLSVKPAAAKTEGDRSVVIQTISGLTRQTAWAELSYLPVRQNYIKVRHNGVHDSVLTNQSGPALIWRPAFPGAFHQLLVNGKPVQAHVEKDPLSHPVSWTEVVVGPGDTATASAPE